MIRIPKTLVSLLAFIAVGQFVGQFAAAQPVPTKLPDSVHLFPAGAQRGTTVKVHIGVEQTPPHARFFINGSGVSGNSDLAGEVFDVGEPSPRRAPTEIPIHYPRQWVGQIAVAADAPVGAAYWDISCAAGGSTGTLPFVVGNLPEFVESESNSTPESAETVALPITVNGQIHGERDLDYYRFHLDAGQVVYCEVLARRLGSRLEPAVALLNDAGEVLPYQEDHLGDDPVLAFKAPSEGTYLLQIGNVSFHGSPAHVYRVNLTHAPVAAAVYPIGAPAGQPTRFTFSVMSGDGQTISWERELTLTSEAGQVELYSDEQLLVPIPLRVLPPDTQVVSAVTDQKQAEIGLAVGQVANGRLSPNSPDVYSLTVDTQQPLDVRVISPVACRGAALVLMEIVDPQGKSVHRTKLAPTSSPTKAYHHMANPRVGKYAIKLTTIDGAASGQASGGYQLEVLPAEPDFQLFAGSDCVSVTQGSSLEILVTATRIGGFSGSIQLGIEGLPEGVVVENGVIPEGKTTTNLKLTVPDSAPSTRHEIRVSGTATANEQQTNRPVQNRHRGHDSGLRSVHQPLRDVIALTIRHKPVFRLYCEEAYQYARRGTVYPYLMTLERLDGFSEDVIVQQADRQNRDLDGIKFLESRISPEQSEFMMPIYLPETMHINIQSQSQLYTQAYASFTDAHGVQQHFLAVAEKRNMLRTMPTVVKLYAEEPIVSGTAGQTIVARFKLERTSNMRNAMKLALHDSKSDRFLIPMQELERDAARVEIPIAIPANMKPGKYELEFRATGQLDAKPEQQVITSAKATVEVRKP